MKKVPKSLKIEVRRGPGGPKDGSWGHFGSQSCRWLKKRRKMRVPGTPNPPPGEPKIHDFLFFLLLISMHFSRPVFERLPGSFLIILGSKSKGKVIQQCDFLQSYFHAPFRTVFS